MSFVVAQRLNANDNQVGVIFWHVEDGSEVEAGADLVDLESSKAVVTIEADFSGRVHLIAKLGAIVNVGDPLCEIINSAEEHVQSSASTHKATAVDVQGDATGFSLNCSTSAAYIELPSVLAPDQTDTQPTTTTFGIARFSHGATRLMTQLKLTAADFPGGGLITKHSVREHGLPRPSVASIEVPANAAPPPLTLMPLGLRNEPLSLSKRAETEALVTGESGLINSMVSICFNSAAIRDRIGREGKFGGSIQPIVLYELSRLLLAWPHFTAFFSGNAVHFYDRIDIGLAIDLGRGLKVVTIRGADRLMPIDFHEQTTEFGLKYLNNEIRPNDLVDSTITVTDLSGFDILHFNPLINGRQSVILGIGADSEQPGYPMCFSMAFDHRVTSGRDAGLFLKELRHRIRSYAPSDNPSGLLSGASSEFPVMNGPIRCERCGIDNPRYHQDNPDARMSANFSANGEIIALCLACASGYS